MCAADPAILCVGGDADSLAIIGLSLQLDDGLRVHSTSVDDAIRWLASRQRPVAIVIDSDTPSPDSSDLAQCIQALAIRPRPAIILVTSAPAPGAMSSPSEGIVGVIIKPFDPFTLSGRIRSYLPVDTGRR